MTDPTLPTPAAGLDRDADRTLSYEGTDIRQRGQWLNLTDMWRAAGSPRYRRPAIWLAMEETRRFRTYARWRWPDLGHPQKRPIVIPGDIRHPGQDHLVTTSRGNRGETWAHWQLALTYARYLSPAFHAWCNTVVRDAIERRSGPVHEGDAVLAFVERQFDQIHRRLDHLNQHAADQMFLLVSAQELMLDQRRNFSERSRALICKVIGAEPYEGQCPCCHAAPVLTATQQPLEGAEYDHFFHRALNRPEHGWLICKGCHTELTVGGYLVRFSRVPEFRRFQATVLTARAAAETTCRHASAGVTLSRPPRGRRT